jgi:hypothetical protein
VPIAIADSLGQADVLQAVLASSGVNSVFLGNEARTAGVGAAAGIRILVLDQHAALARRILGKYALQGDEGDARIGERQ